MIKVLDEYTACDTKKLTIFNKKHPEWEPWHTFNNKEDFNYHINQHFIPDNTANNKVLQLFFTNTIY